jgi:Tol biopolymer transport system component
MIDVLQRPNLYYSPVELGEPCVSPDGRWIAFTSLESGHADGNIATSRDFADKRQVWNSGGVQPRSRGEEKELYYLSLDAKMIALDVSAESGPDTIVPTSAL